MTIHDFDMARWIIGDEVQQVFTSANTLVDPAIARLGDVDTALVSLRYRGGALGSIDNSRKAVYGYDQRLEVFGSEGCIIVGNALENTLVQHDRHGSHGAPALHFFVERYEQAYLTEMRAFVECVRTGTTPPVTGIDGRVPLVMALAAERSRRTNAPVTID
jgi:myo-inositol 2-dehydrogenase/D-chiro-inositol 1-dehydrogenase